MIQSFVFPEEITISEQKFNIESFSNSWKSSILTLAERILNEYKKKGEGRFLVAIGGPSGTGKSTISTLLAEIINAQTESEALHVSLDGYHFEQNYLSNHEDIEGIKLAEHKGRYDSYNTEKLERDLISFSNVVSLSFPEYSRKEHNPIENAIECTTDRTILLLEGLWLLHNEEPWNRMTKYYDFTVFFNSKQEFREKNTITRHVHGGRSQEESRLFYNKSDKLNDIKIMKNIIPHDLDFMTSV